jgi:hypothetical protein
MTTRELIESKRQRRPSFGRSKEARGADLFDTPPIALDPLFEHEPLLAGVRIICEPAAGRGNLVKAMRARGITVHASDLSDRGCPDAKVLDFFAMTERPPGCDVLVTNPPYSRAMDFIEHAIDVLGFRLVVLLLQVDFVCTDDRYERLHTRGILRRIHVPAERLQNMHDAAHLAAGGKKASQPLKHAWYIFDRDHRGSATINPVSLKRPSARMSWLQSEPAPLVPAPASPLASALNGSSALAAHSPFGGSIAARILNCPASVDWVAKVPSHLRKSSTYAARGSALHGAMNLLIEREVSLDEIVGRTIDGYVITRDDVENFLRPVLAYVDALLDQPGAEYYFDCRVVFPTIDGAFGTADLIVRIGNTVYVIDFKFGSGVRVLALYPDGDEDVINAQIQFYAAGARHSLPEFFAAVDTIILTILQPQSIDVDAEMVSSVAVTHAELDEFITVYRAACAEALSPTPRLQRGDHCRFCPAQLICPKHTGPVFDLAMFELPARSAPDYYQALSRGLALVNDIEDIAKALRDQVKAALLEGHAVEGFTLTKGRAVRHWQDEDVALIALIELGLATDDVIDTIMRSPKQVELRAKARGVKVPPELIVSTRSGVSLTREENAHAPILSRGERVQAWAEVIDSIQKGDRHGTTN